MHSNRNGQHIPGNTFIPLLNATVARKSTLVWYKQKHLSTLSPTLQMEHWNVVVMVLLDWAHKTQYEGAAAQWSVSQVMKRGNLMDYQPGLLLLLLLLLLLTWNKNVDFLHSFLRNMKPSHTTVRWSYFPTTELNNQVIQHKYIHQWKSTFVHFYFHS